MVLDNPARIMKPTVDSWIQLYINNEKLTGFIAWHPWFCLFLSENICEHMASKLL
jgi:hypothetical protein